MENNGPLVIIALTFFLLGAVVDLKQHVTTLVGWCSEIYFAWTANRPFPHRLEERDLKCLSSSGDLRLSVLRINSFLNRLDIEGSWLDQCLSNETLFCDDDIRQAQMNRVYKLEPNDVDRHNLSVIKAQLEKIDKTRVEARKFLSIYPLKDRVGLRAQSQLLYDFRNSELSQLSPGDLYLLRNEIYARHGMRFHTPKLIKYFNRRCWYVEDSDFRFGVIPKLKACNAYLLQERGPRTIPGAFGRAVHVSIDAIPQLANLPYSLENCFRERNTGVEVVHVPKVPLSELFRTQVDLIVAMKRDSQTRIRLTELDEKHFAETNRLLNTGRLRAALGRVARKASAFLSKVGTDQGIVPISFCSGDHIGIEISLSGKLLSWFFSKEEPRQQFEDLLCTETVDFLDHYGDAIPNMTATNDEEEWILPKMVKYCETRRRLSLAYLRDRYGLDLCEPVIEPKIIVVHWTAIDTLDASFNAFKAPRLAWHRIGIAKGGKVNVGAHYLVDRDGKVYRMIDDTLFARHTIGLNYNAIGIENVGGNAGTPLTPKQLESNERLVRYLANRFPIKWLIGHHEYGKFRGSELWLETDPSYFTVKIDPGAEFMAALRAKLIDLSLLSEPIQR